MIPALPDALQEAFQRSATLGMPDLARLIPMDAKTLRKHRDAGDLPGMIKGFGRKKPRWIFTQADVTAFLAARDEDARAAHPAVRPPRAPTKKTPGANRARGFIYFVTDGEFIKIGWSKNWRKRIGILQVSNPKPLQVLAVCTGTVFQENQLHHRFARHRTSGEWHACDPDILNHIATIERVDL